jgi:hypothetical protein
MAQREYKDNFMNRRKFLKNLLIASLAIPILLKAAKSDNTNLITTDIGDTEWGRCANDPVYFINNYVKVMNPVRGKLPFTLNPAQEKIIREFEKSNRHAIVQDRQVGMTSLASAYALWLMVFKPSQNVLFGTYSNAGCDHQMKIFRFAYHNLPEWMKVPLIRDNKHSLTMSHGSKITVVSTRQSRSYGCGEYYTMVAVDDAAFCEDMREFMNVVYPSITGEGTKTIMYSSYNPAGSRWLSYADHLHCKWHSL